MNSELFRFATIRQPKRTIPEESQIRRIPLLDEPGNGFLRELRAAKLSGARDRILDLASGFTKSPEFVDSQQKLDPKYAQLVFIVRDHSNRPDNSYFRQNFESIFSTEGASFVVDSATFKTTENNITNSIIASTIIPTVSSATKSFNVFVKYTLHLIKQLATNSISSEKINDAIIVIPKGIFPLPQPKDTLREEHRKEQEERKKIIEETNKKIEETTQHLKGNNNAILEVINAFEKSDLDQRKRSRGFILSREVSHNISDETKRIVKNHGLSADEIDVAKTVAILDKSNISSANKLSKNLTMGRKIIKVGSVFLPADYIFPLTPVVSPGFPKPLSKVPGACPPVPITNDNQHDGEVTTPIGHGYAHAFEIADLMVVEQNLSHYELGEIAHIENVLKSEIRERELRTTKSREESQLIETEETAEKTKDLSTAERSELNTESQQVISENSSKQAGITVSGSYGPSVDVTAEYNTSSSTSTQDSKSASSNFARETTVRAINRIETRKLQRRLVRTMEEVVEVNKHIFENQAQNADNISGIYRWVDKVYELQIINYGKRLMMEFIVPEPAAFLRYSLSRLPTEGITIEKPDPPGYCLSDGKTFEPLLVEDITREYYTIWVAKYNVQGVSPPPERVITVSQSKLLKTSEVMTFESLSHRLSVADGYIEVPDGYIPYEAKLNFRWAGGSAGEMYLQIQDKQVSSLEAGDGGVVTVQLYSLPGSTVYYTIDSNHMYTYSVIIDVLCTLSDSKFAEWQLNTYNSIINTYNDQKSRYDSTIEAARLRTGFSEIKGKNPFFNREIEKTELKKGCLSILTAQRYEAFDAVKKNVAPHGYPEIVEFDEAMVDGEYIRRFEQAFEWPNMTYVFYPYFWGNKEDWVMLSKLDDEDQLFSRFLQAGASRVLVPVRPGFEKTVIDYLELETEWNAEGTVVTEGDEIDSVNMSIVEEIKSQSGNNSVDGEGTLKVKKGSVDITGTETEFSRYSDENRRIIIKGVTYVIKKVMGKTKIVLTSAYTDNDDTGVIYALGGILVGQSWKVKLPTNLVRLDPNAEVLIK